MATVQSEVGPIFLMEDFCGPEVTVAETAAGAGTIGPFRCIGDSITNGDSGITIDESTAPLNGVGVFTTTDEAKKAVGLCTSKMFDVAKMGPIVMEYRGQFDDTDGKHFFFGLTDENADDLSIEDDIVSGATETLTINADYVTGFFYDEGLSDDEDWHAVYKGGTTSAETTSTSVDLDDDIVAGEFQILRLEVDPDGTARWYIDGVLLKTVEGAASLTTDMAMVCVVESSASAIDYAWADYIFVKAHRDWTV